MTKRQFWTHEQDEVLRAGFDTLTLAELCEQLGREPNAVGARCATLGLRAPRHGTAALAQIAQALRQGVAA